MNYNELIKEIETRFSLDNQAARSVVFLVLDWLGAEQ